MYRIFLVLPVLLTGCGIQTENSDSLDVANFGPPTAIKAIFTQNCGGLCHSFQSMSIDDMVKAGLLAKGNPSASPIYFRLKSAASGPGPRTMPANGSTLSESDTRIIEDFVQNAE